MSSTEHWKDKKDNPRPGDSGGSLLPPDRQDLLAQVAAAAEAAAEWDPRAAAVAAELHDASLQRTDEDR